MEEHKRVSPAQWGKIFTLLLCLFCALFCACGSAPAPEPAQVAEDTGAKDEIKAANEAAISQAKAKRQAAIDAGAEETAGDKLAAADALLEAIEAKAAAGEDVSAQAAEVATLYDALAEYSQAIKAKQKIDEGGWASYNQTEYDRGETSLKAANELLGTEGTTAGALYEKAHEANDAYSKVLDGVYRDKAQKERTAAFKAKRAADGVYAGVSQKERYSKAVESFRNGDSQYTFHHAETAYNNYVKAREEFEALYTDISASMAEADRAIEAAKKKRDESAALAKQADKSKPIDADNENLVQEGQTVLEEETYADPAQSVEEVSADLPEGGE